MKTIMIIIFLFVLIFSSCDKNNNEQEKNELESNKLINKNWILYASIYNDDNDTMLYADGIDKIWLNFTDDSVFIHGFCPTTGTWYRIFSTDSLNPGSFLMQEECAAPFESHNMNHILAYDLGSSDRYAIINNQLTIYTHGRFNFILNGEQPDSVENSME